MDLTMIRVLPLLCGLAMLAVAVPTAAQDRAPPTLFIDVHIFDGLSAVTSRDRD